MNIGFMLRGGVFINAGLPLGKEEVKEVKGLDLLYRPLEHQVLIIVGFPLDSHIVLYKFKGELIPQIGGIQNRNRRNQQNHTQNRVDHIQRKGDGRHRNNPGNHKVGRAHNTAV